MVYDSPREAMLRFLDQTGRGRKDYVFLYRLLMDLLPEAFNRIPQFTPLPPAECSGEAPPAKLITFKGKDKKLDGIIR